MSESADAINREETEKALRNCYSLELAHMVGSLNELQSMRFDRLVSNKGTLVIEWRIRRLSRRIGEMRRNLVGDE